MEGEAPVDVVDDVLAAVVGLDRAAEVRRALDAAGLVVVRQDVMAQVRSEAEGFRRMRRLVEPDAD